MTTFIDLIENMHTVFEAKNHDYGADIDPWANFRLVELLGLTPAQGVMVRMLDKVARLAQFFRSGELRVKDESVNDTLIDLANYALITYLLLEEERTEKPKPAPDFDSISVYVQEALSALARRELGAVQACLVTINARLQTLNGVEDI